MKGTVGVSNPEPVAGTRAVAGRDRCTDCGAVVDVDTIDGALVDYEPGSTKVHECPTGDETDETDEPLLNPPMPVEFRYLGRCFTWIGSERQWSTFRKVCAKEGNTAAVSWAIRHEAVVE